MNLKGNEKNKGNIEVKVFTEFVEKAEANIDINTIEKRLPPEPDILCRDLDGNYIAFELAELCSQEMAHLKAKPREGTIRVDTREDVRKITTNKNKKSFKYETKHPIEILYYTSDRTHPNEDVIINSINTGYSKYRKIWFLGVEKTKLISSTII